MLAATTPLQLCAWAALVSAVALTALWIRSAFVSAIFGGDVGRARLSLCPFACFAVGKVATCSPPG